MSEIENQEVFEEEVVEEQDIVEETTDDSDEEQIDWQARAEKAEETIIKSKEKRKEEKATPKAKVEASDDAILARLENRGVMDEADQNYILRFAKSEGISPVEALQDQIVIDRISANKQARESVQAKPTSNNRTGNGQVNNLAKAVARFEKDGTVPTDTKLATQVLAQLSNKN